LRYGLPYKGSKNGIAEWVCDNLPNAEKWRIYGKGVKAKRNESKRNQESTLFF
jgi:hypothetical protein